MLLNRKIPLHYILNTIKYEVLYVLVIGLIVHFLTYQFKTLIPIMPIAIPTFIGTAISVILSFKLNQSYERWWEARKIWGAIVNDSRNLILQLQSFIELPLYDDVKKIAYRQIAWCYCLGRNLRGEDVLKNMERFFSDEDLAFIKQHGNKPLAILQLNARHLQQLRKQEALQLFSHVELNTTVVNLTNSMGMAERIKNTVFPVTYKYFLHLIIYLFVITLSIAMRDIESYFEIPLLLIISMAFFLLEKTASHLQDPFNGMPTDISVTAIATTIEINIRELLDEKYTPDPLTTDDFYLM